MDLLQELIIKSRAVVERGCRALLNVNAYGHETYGCLWCGAIEGEPVDGAAVIAHDDSCSFADLAQLLEA